MIPLNRADIGEEEIAAVAVALRSGHLAGDGPATKRVQYWLAARLDVPHVLLTTSCTHALELALMALGIGPGDEVIVPSFTFVSTANVVLRQGARPVFAEIDARTFNLDPDDVRRRITPRTRVIMPVHYAGVACPMDPLTALAEQHGLRVIEDAAQALNATYKGRPLGAIGHAGGFSFHGTKNITCGEGGALVTHDKELARRAEIMREKGTNRAAFLRGEVDKYTWVESGSSFVMADMLAALLEVQLARMDELQAVRARLAAFYLAELAPLHRAGRLQLPHVPPEASPNWHLFHFLVATEEERSQCLQYLRSRGIGAAFHFVPLHSSPFGRSLSHGEVPDLPVTDRVSRTLVRIPLYPGLTIAEAEHVVASVYEFFQERRPAGAAVRCRLSVVGPGTDGRGPTPDGPAVPSRNGKGAGAAAPASVERAP